MVKDKKNDLIITFRPSKRELDILISKGYVVRKEFGKPVISKFMNLNAYLKDLIYSDYIDESEKVLQNKLSVVQHRRIFAYGRKRIYYRPDDKRMGYDQ